MCQYTWNRTNYYRAPKSQYNKLQVEKIHSVTTGYFRMPNNFFNKLINIRPEDSLIFNQLKNEGLMESHNQKQECKKELIKFIDQKILFSN